MQATEKIWMNGELVDWDDAHVHVGAHGLHYGTGRLRGHPLLRHAEGPGGLPAHRPHAAPARLGAADRHGDPVLGRRARAATNDLIAANGLPECYIRPIAFYGFGELGVSARGNPVETVIMTWPWGTYLGEEALEDRHPHEDLDLAAHPAERRPARVEGDRRLPQLDARGHRGAERRLRRGDHADARGHRRRRPGRDDLRRPRRRDLHARPLDRDPARDHARLGDPDRAGPRLRGASRRR